MGIANITPFLASRKLDFTIASEKHGRAPGICSRADGHRHAQFIRWMGLSAREMQWATKKR
jgi:hypothetical protein